MISGRYTLDREVGRGGMGAVWRGEDELLHRPVAIKRIGFAPTGGVDDSSDLVRAEREARLAAMINHPHIVSVYDLVEDDERQWLVMEYVDGTALSTILDTQGAVAPDRAAHLLAQAADALAAAHHAGIVHRDVKPSNMLVTPDDTLKITDFGIARGLEDASLTRTGMVTGSPAYLAPEVASGQSATAASDVWSLGATLFHTLTGRTPYAVDDNVLGTLYRIVNSEPPRLGPGDRLAPLLEHTMALDPSQRWSMTEVRDFLRGSAAPVRDRPAATTDRTAPPTQTLAAVPPTFLESAARRQEERPPASPPPGGGRNRPDDRSRTLPALLVGVAILLVVLLGLGFVVLGGDDGDQDATAPSETPTSAAPSPSDPGPTSPTPSPSPSQEPDAEEMATFVDNYLGTVVADPSSSWQQLTPAFQQASGGFGQYSGFWSNYTSATPRDVSADPDALTVSYTVDYVLADGREDTDQVTLQLAYEGGQYLISGES
ncbi:hypothetical protein GCM10009737_34390 [Nocardioides lentus]|uniref:non-specific serine/threonine protein kinase n=1 Tax=Nocardioides lentus TaxID=338077 RepID=A0ABN2PUN0_9ACTN